MRLAFRPFFLYNRRTLTITRVSAAICRVLSPGTKNHDEKDHATRRAANSDGKSRRDGVRRAPRVCRRAPRRAFRQERVELRDRRKERIPRASRTRRRETQTERRRSERPSRDRRLRNRRLPGRPRGSTIPHGGRRRRSALPRGGSNRREERRARDFPSRSARRDERASLGADGEGVRRARLRVVPLRVERVRRVRRMVRASL